MWPINDILAENICISQPEIFLFQKNKLSNSNYHILITFKLAVSLSLCSYDPNEHKTNTEYSRR